MIVYPKIESASFTQRWYHNVSSTTKEWSSNVWRFCDVVNSDIKTTELDAVLANKNNVNHKNIRKES